jgi:hypothetical protein
VGLSVRLISAWQGKGFPRLVVSFFEMEQVEKIDGYCSVVIPIDAIFRGFVLRSEDNGSRMIAAILPLFPNQASALNRKYNTRLIFWRNIWFLSLSLIWESEEVAFGGDQTQFQNLLAYKPSVFPMVEIGIDCRHLFPILVLSMPPMAKSFISFGGHTFKWYTC